MRWLATVAEMCKDKKGGALLSALHVLMHHGDPKVQAWLEPLLAAVSIIVFFLHQNVQKIKIIGVQLIKMI
jgi:hypothetical protein